MKRLFLLLMFAVVALSCEEIQDFIDPKGHGLVFLEGEMKAYFDDKGDTKNYKFKADLAWSAEVSADWIEVDPTSGPAGENKIKIKVDKNKSDEKRTGYVDITLSNEKSYRIELEQLASGENLDDIIEPTTPIPNNEIWYTNGSTTEPTYPNEANAFGVNIISNSYDAEKECWVIKFDGDVTTIGDWAFCECDSLTSVTIGDSVTSIGDYAFAACESLTSVTIPNNVTTIGDWVFSKCYSLTSVTIGYSVTRIGSSAFASCNSLREFNGKFASEDGRCLIIDGTLNSFAPAGLSEYNIPDSVTTIGVEALCYCSSLTSITIPDSVTTIGERAFFYCSSLTSVTIPDSVTTIGEWAFSDCSSLTGITIPDSVTTIGEGAFFHCDSLTSVTIPDSVTTIGDHVFSGCCSLTSVTIPDSVTTIGEGAFSICSSLTNVTIPDSVTSIGDYAFGGCSSLTSVTIPGSVTTIENQAFFYCSSLTSVYCKAIIPPIAVFDDSSWIWNAFDLNAFGRKIYVPMESVEVYKSADGWSEYADAIVGYDFDSNNTETDMAKPANNEIWYTSADGNIVEPCSAEYVEYEDIYSAFGANIISNAYDAEKECWVIKFDVDVTTIGYGAFARCSSLTSVTIPDCVTELGRSAFACCYELTSATIGDSVTVIGMGAFAECDSLTNVNIPNSVTKIGESAFHECHSLTNVTIPDSVTVIEMGAFFWCTNITSVTIGNSVTTIEMGAFSGCHNLQEFNGKFASEDGRCLIIDGVLNSFAIGCSATEYTIPDGVTSIGGWAFYECSNLTSVTIGDSVTTIGECAFAGCDSLTSITIPDSVTTIGDHVFQGCSSLTSVTIPDSVTTIGERAFEYCSSLTSVYCKAITPPTTYSSMFSSFSDPGRTIYVPIESVEAYKSADGWSEYADAIVGYDF